MFIIVYIHKYYTLSMGGKMEEYKTTEEIKVPEKLIDQIIGQEKAVEIVKKAAKQRRNVLLIGSPGTGKSMLAQAMTELMPAEDLEDVLCYPNHTDDNNPKIITVKTYPSKEEIEKDQKLKALYSKDIMKARHEQMLKQKKATEEKKENEKIKDKKEDIGQGRRILNLTKRIRGSPSSDLGPSPLLIVILIAIIAIIALYMTNALQDDSKWFILAFVFGMGFLYFLFNFSSKIGAKMGLMTGGFGGDEPKLIVDNSGKRTAPFEDATGAKAGALLGDVRHDPLQCIPGDELVNLPNGKIMEISKLINPLLKNGGEKELKQSEIFEVLGGYDNQYCYSPTKVTKIFKRKYKGKIYEIETRRGYKIKVTPNHPLAIIKENGDIDYIDAKNINKTCSLVLPYKLPINKKETYKYEFLKFIGFVLADAYIGQRRIDFKVKREFKIKEIEKCLKENKFKYTKRNYRGATLFGIHDAKLVKTLLGLGIKKDKKKSIPSFVYNLGFNEIIYLLSSYLSMDGHVNKQGQFELFSKELIDEITSLMLKIGIRAKIKQRIDPGFGKLKQTVQRYIIFNDYQFSQEYYKNTLNPIHKNNLTNYLNSTKSTHVTYDDEIPLRFKYLEKIREKTGLSKEKIHKEYYALKPDLKSSKNLTRQFLDTICSRFLSLTNCPNLIKLKTLSNGSYSFDEIKTIKQSKYEGFVYNLTTETGNYLVKNILTHNSGGLGTPPHLRVEAGAIHKANKGVLFMDEVTSLTKHFQQELLTAMQEKKYPITGQSEMSSGAIVKTEAVPCDFVLVAAGNVPDMQTMHPALRSRIRGAGYEIYVEDHMPDNKENEEKLIKFVAQEVKKDKKIPHFTEEAVHEIIEEARRKSTKKHSFTLNLRELGGIVRAAGDIAKEENMKYVLPEHVKKAKKISGTLEQQIAEQYIELKKSYKVFQTKGYEIGRVNGLAVLGDPSSGLVLPIVAEVTPSFSKGNGKFIATGKLGTIAKEAVDNVSAIIKKHVKKDMSKNDVHIQFLQTYEGVEGDSASIAVAVSVISAMESLPIDQTIGMTGSLSVRGEVLPVGGVTGKVQACIEAGLEKVIVPKSNLEDIYISKEDKNKIKIIPVESIQEVLKHVLKKSAKTTKFIKGIKK